MAKVTAIVIRLAVVHGKHYCRAVSTIENVATSNLTRRHSQGARCPTERLTSELSGAVDVMAGSVHATITEIRDHVEVNYMDPAEIMKAAPEIAKGLAAVGAAIPFTGIVKRMLGPASDELAEMWRDQVRLYRYGRQMKCIEKAEKMAQDAGFTPQAVPPKILFPLLEGASFEDNEDLHTMWSALLANASSPAKADKVRPGFIAMLKHMSPDEAALLNWIYDTADNPAPLNQISLIEAYARLGFGPKDGFDRHEQLDRSHTFLQQFATSRDSLEAARLLRRSVREDDQTQYSISLTGRAFVSVCRPPKLKT